MMMPDGTEGDVQENPMKRPGIDIPRRGLAAALVAALLVTAPGLPCYQALAQARTASAAAKSLPGGLKWVPLGAVGARGAGHPSGAVRSFAPASVPSGAALPSIRTDVPTAVGARGSVRSSVNPGALAPHPAGAAQPAQTRPGRSLGAGRAAPGAARNGPDGLIGRLLEDPGSVTRSAGEISRMPVDAARSLGSDLMDAALGERSIAARSAPIASIHGPTAPAEAGPGPALRSTAGRSPVDAGAGRVLRGGAVPPAPIPPEPPAGANRAVSVLRRIAAGMATAAFGGGAAFGLHHLAVWMLPGMFGFLPIAAVWAVGSGLVVLPGAFYSRYRLGLRDSPRLMGVKIAFDLALGVFLGAAAIALPPVLSGAVVLGLGAAVIPGAAATLAVTGAYLAPFDSRIAAMMGWVKPLAAWGALAFLPSLVGTALSGHVLAFPLTLGSILGMMALPVMMQFNFFLGPIIAAAESGQPFSLFARLRTIRFPAYTWVMTGVVFALLTGYVPVYVNWALFLWMFLKDAREEGSLRALFPSLGGSSWWERLLNSRLWKAATFNNVYLAVAAYAVLTGFSAPVTFLVLAFLPERASFWGERLLSRLLPRGEPAPSSIGRFRHVPESERPANWPKLHLWLKAGFFLGSLTGLSALVAHVFGWTALLSNTALAAAVAFIPFWFGTRIIKAVLRAEPTDETRDPEIFAAMKDLLARINAERSERGKKSIPMPEIVKVPMPVPNAFATGRGPSHALVGVTEEFKRMTLDAETHRAGLIRLLEAADMAVKQASSPEMLEKATRRFQAFRMAVSGSIPGIGEDADPADVIQAVRTAGSERLRALGFRVLRGVLAHEFTHVKQRHMLVGTITGSISSGIAYTCYNVMWQVSRAKKAVREFLERAAPRRNGPGSGPKAAAGRARAISVGVKPELIEPFSTGAAVKTVADLILVFAAGWAPVIAIIQQMTISRQNEGSADEGGALLSEDPEALALGLGLLATWRPPSGGIRGSLDRLHYWTATTHLFTVNPLHQLQEAGVLGEGTAVAAYTKRPVEWRDNWLFNLFVTHPDTALRIERLYEMAGALRRKAFQAFGGRDIRPGGLGRPPA